MSSVRRCYHAYIRQKNYVWVFNQICSSNCFYAGVFIFVYIIDGIFISNFVGEDGLSGLNIVFPVINIIMGIATMFATGGSAIVAKKMGEGKKEEANQNFTFLFVVLMAVGALVTIGVLVFIDPLLSFLGAIETLYTYSYDYLFTTVMFTLVTMAKLYFDFFLVTSGKANLALINSVIGGVTNVILDYVFMGLLNMGMAGAAYATEIAMILPVILSFIYFASKKLTICFAKPKAGIKLVLSACANGSSEMVVQISAGISTFLFNLYMLQYVGKTGSCRSYNCDVFTIFINLYAIGIFCRYFSFD